MISQDDIDAFTPELPPVIGLAGAAGSGKSTAAEAIAHELYPDAIRVRFADPLKMMMRTLYQSVGLDAVEIERRIEGDLKEQADDILGGASPRVAMQTLGTEWGRYQFGGDFWVSLWRRRVRYAQTTTPGAIIIAEDVRFGEEMRAVRSLGGVVIGITGRGGIGGEHDSEKGLKGTTLDAVVINGPDVSPAQLAGLVLNAASHCQVLPQ